MLVHPVYWNESARRSLYFFCTCVYSMRIELTKCRATCCGLFGLIQMSHNPFHNHLFGRIDPDAILVESNTAPYSFVSYSDKINGSLHSHSNSINSIETPVARDPPPPAGAVPAPQMREYALPVNLPVAPHPFAGHPLAASRPDTGGSGTHPIHRSASYSNLTVPRRPVPLRRAPSAPSLMPTIAGEQRIVAHQRSWSASSAYPLHRSLSQASLHRPLTPMAAAFSDSPRRMPAAVYRQQMRLASPSAWRAVHPPAHHFRHVSSAVSAAAGDADHVFHHSLAAAVPAAPPAQRGRRRVAGAGAHGGVGVDVVARGVRGRGDAGPLRRELGALPRAAAAVFGRRARIRLRGGDGGWRPAPRREQPRLVREWARRGREPRRDAAARPRRGGRGRGGGRLRLGVGLGRAVVVHVAGGGGRGWRDGGGAAGAWAAGRGE